MLFGRGDRAPNGIPRRSSVASVHGGSARRSPRTRRRRCRSDQCHAQYGDDTDRELDSSRNISYAFELTGLRSAADLGEIEAALGRLPGVRARIVYPSATAYLTAPETVSLEKLVAVLAEFGAEFGPAKAA